MTVEAGTSAGRAEGVGKTGWRSSAVSPSPPRRLGPTGSPRRDRSRPGAESGMGLVSGRPTATGPIHRRSGSAESDRVDA